MNKTRILRGLCSKKHYGLAAFVLGLLLSGALFVPVIIENGGLFLYYGDFNAQEVPFYQMIHDAVRSGSFNWSSTTDLGCGVLCSYSFYLLGSPFFWLTIPFPSSAVPYLMGPLFILKFACASLTAYIYIKRYVSNGLFAVAGGLLYAFSGFSVYNIFFFHFHEPMIVFPLLLAAVDKFMYEDRRGFLGAAVFLCCVTNYYFFAGMAVFTAVYWLMLVFTNNYRLTVKRLGLFIFEVLTGFAAAAFILLPTVLFISGNPRLSQMPDGFDALAYNMPQRYWYIILSFFFPPELAAQPNFTPDADCNWASVSGWLPLFGMTGVIGYLQLRQRGWLKKLIVLLMLFAMVPLLNSMFQLLNSSIYYARWFYMLVLMLVLATVSALENKETDWNRAFCWSAGITAGIALLIGLMPKTVYDDDDFATTYIGLEEYPVRYWIYVGIAMVSLLCLALIIKKYRTQSKRLALCSLAGICVITLLSGTYIVQTGNSLDGKEKKFIRSCALNCGDKLGLEDIQSVRSDFYECTDNLAMYWQIPSINAFHSVVPPSVMTFYDSLGVTRDVASRPETDYYGIRGLFSCKYLFDQSFDDKDGYKFVEKGKAHMPGWRYLKTVNGCKVYENNYYIPMGFMYSSFIASEEFEQINLQNRSEALLKAMVLSLEDMEKYRDITGYTEDEYKDLKYDIKSGKTHNFKSKTEDFIYGRYEYFDDCLKLRESSCESFEYTSSGFEAVMNNKGEDNLVFFSVPYDKGWSARVNGEDAQIVQANNGFMAVRVPGGEISKIKFEYYPCGFRTGIIISICCGIIFLIYLSILLLYRRKRSSQQGFI